MIPPLLRHALSGLAPHRFDESWIAGSVVLAHLISRAPQDIDIHHVSSPVLFRKIEEDRARLVSLGFSPGTQRRLSEEHEIRFSHSDGSITVNWVLEPHPPRHPLVADPLLGMRASLSEVLARKFEMYADSRDPKHRADLEEIAGQTGAITSEVNISAFRRNLAGVLPAVPSDLRL